MSPLQYQKQLRLQEARSILTNERRDVGTVSRRVGYESSSQFSREYSRLFGKPQVREIRNGTSRPKPGDALRRHMTSYILSGSQRTAVTAAANRLRESVPLNALVMSNVVKEADSPILIRGVDQS